MNRTSMLTTMGNQEWDLLVIGGGISGAGAAREAAARGLRVALVEQGDFASGTSSRSGKMIIGGLRYLLKGEVHLVRKGLKERDWLVSAAPHLVHWTPYLFPVWGGDPDSFWKVRAGLTLYDLLAAGGLHRRHRSFDATSVLLLENGLREEGLRGGVQYWDCMTDDARLTLETMGAAVNAGAVIANYARAVSFLKTAGQVRGAVVHDVINDTKVEVRARTVLVAAGPWADRVRQLDESAAIPLLRLVKGSFIVVPRARMPVARNVTLRAADQRMTFAVPLHGQTYIGTTEVDYAGDLGNVWTSSGEVEYLLGAANKAFPEAHLTTDDVISSWAGLRPLVGSKAGESPSKVSRDFQIIKHASGLAVLAGGKLTGFRAMGEQVVDLLFPNTSAARRKAENAMLPGAGTARPSRQDVEMLARQTEVPSFWLEPILKAYGSRFTTLASELPQDTEKGTESWLRARTRFAVKHEMAQHVSDVLRRRTNVMLFEAGNGLEVAPLVASEMAQILSWSHSRIVQEVNEYREQVRQMWAWRNPEKAPATARPGGRFSASRVKADSIL